MKETAEQRLGSARQRLDAARLLHENGFEPDAISRLYYGVFEAARALLSARDLDAKTHKGVAMYLGRQFRSRIDTALLTKLRQDREDCDYHLYRPSPKIVDRYINDAQRFVDRVMLQVQGGGPGES